jgi:hypothetical protein
MSTDISDIKESQWEMFCDESYYGMWAVRDLSDTSFESPRLFHFNTKTEAEQFLALVQKSNCAVGKPMKINKYLKYLGIGIIVLFVLFEFQSCLEWQKVINYRNNYEDMVKQTVKDMVKKEVLNESK